MLKIFFVDLTHTYIALANGTFPLGAAYAASYIKEVLGDDVDITLFKYPEKLEEKIGAGDYPDVFMYSSYLWNEYLGAAFAKEIKRVSPKTLVISGGPNISKESDKQKKFLEKNSFIDFFILNEGEVASAELLCRYIDKNYCIESLKRSVVRQSLSIYEGELLVGEAINRIGVKKDGHVKLQSDKQSHSVSELDDIPSPYLNGMMDQFFDNKLYPLVETNRGCPFACTFCQQGVDYFNSVAVRRSDMVEMELEYVAQKMAEKSPGIARIEFADPNFAMFKQDLKTTECIFRLQGKYGWPKIIGCSTGKNKPRQVIEAVEKVMPNSLIISNSMQSTNLDTLNEIKRSNINLGAYTQIQSDIQSRGLRSMADVILGLPLETKESHFKAIYSLIDSGVQEFTSYQAMVLKSTELEERSSADKYGLVTKSRVLPRAMGLYKINNTVVPVADVETIIVSTETLSFDDYLSSRVLHLLAGIYHNSGVFNIIDNILKKNDISKSKIISVLHQRVEKKSSNILLMVDKFIEDTKGELFDTEEECLSFYCNEDNVIRVKNAEIGGNLMWKYIGLALFKFWESVVDEIIISLRVLLDFDQNIIDDIRSYLLARVVNVSAKNIEPSISIKLRTNFISEFTGVYSDNSRFIMSMSDGYYKSIVHYRSIFSNNSNGWSLILAQLRVHSFVRDDIYASPLPE